MDILNFNEISTVMHYLGSKKHSHQNCEFLFILSGAINNQAGTDVTLLSVGDICFMNTNCDHVLDYSEHQACHRDLFISTENLKEVCLTFFDEHFFNYLMQKDKNMLIPITAEHFRALTTRLNEIEINYKYNKIDQEFYIKSLFSIIIELLGSLYYSLNINEKKTKTNEMILSLLHKLNDPNFFTLPIPDIIQETNYSHSHFDLIFKKEMGCSLKKYITSLKINYAKELLTQSTLSLSDIAHKLGYDSQSHFTQIFKRATNLSPHEYRNMHQ